VPDERTYRGWLVEADWGEGMDLLWLVPEAGASPAWDDYPLADRIEEGMDELGRYLSVRYWTGKAEKSRDDLEHDLILWQIGEGDADVGHHYSDVTGYLWTDEAIRVGGHDLIEELHGHVGEWLHLEIGYSKTPEVRASPITSITIFSASGNFPPGTPLEVEEGEPGA
jgi:hypothetical protein